MRRFSQSVEKSFQPVPYQDELKIFATRPGVISEAVGH